MRFLNQYIFKKECFGFNQEEILSAFENNFIRTNCYHKIFKYENKLDLINDFFEFNYLYKFISSGNLWQGIGNMNITFLPGKLEGSHIIQFSISIYRQLFFFLILNIIGGIILLSNYSLFILYVFILYNTILIITTLIKYLQHRYFFNKTIKIGDFYKNQVLKSYDWELILKNKTNIEINAIIQGKTHLPDIVIELAKKEMNNRKEIK